MKAIFMILIVILTSGTAFSEGAAESADENVVNVYSHRHYDVDQELYERFTELTGIEVNVVKAGADELIERLRSEGSASPADVLITVDAGRLQKAVDMNLLQVVKSEELDAAVPGHLRHPDGYWYGLTKRARVLAYSNDRVDRSELSTYEDLADPKWAGRIVVRSSSNIYNQSLMAAMIAANGVAAATEWAKALVNNMARKPEGSDRDQVKAVAAGLADIAIVNTYYLGKLLTSDDPDEVAAGRSVNLFFPNQNGRGAHINVSGAGVTAYAPHRDNAIRFIVFLTSVEAQERYAAGNFEYPVREDVAPADLVSSWGDFREDDVNLSVLGDLNIQAVIAFDKAGWK